MEHLIDVVLQVTGESRESFERGVEELKHSSATYALQVENELLRERLERAEKALDEVILGGAF